MATITTRSFGQIIQSWQAAAQASAARVGRVLDFSIGSINLALAEAAGTIGLWLQKVALEVLALSRFATSLKSDADSWGAQFGYMRLPATYATGIETATRNDTTTQAVVPIGTVLQTQDGTQSFTVTVDTSNSAYSESLDGYVLAIGIGTVNFPVQANTLGAGGNINANTLTVIVSGISGIDAVTNNAAFANGLAAETDEDYKARFPLWLAALASADYAAIASAIEGVQQGLNFLLVANYDYPGSNPDPGSFFAIVDDGSGSPSTNLLNLVFAAVDAVRGFTIRCQGVYGPSAVTVNLVGSITSNPGYNHASVVTGVDAAWASYLNTLWANWVKTVPLRPAPPTSGPPVTIAALAAVAMSVPGCININTDSILINSSNADLPMTIVQRPIAGTISTE